MAPESNEKVLLKINTIENDLKHLQEDVTNISKHVDGLADMRGDMKVLNEHLLNIAGNQSESIKVVKKDLNSLGDKIRGVEAKVISMSTAVTESRTKIEFNERVFWILFAAAIGVAQHFFKV